MISLPGLHSSAPAPPPTEFTSTVIQTRTQDLSANTEYRFEVSFSRTLTIKVLSGTAELFGTELGPSTTYQFKGTKGAIYTWHGCKLEIGGDAESEYVAEETTMMSYANAHFALEGVRERAGQRNELGPRVLVVGPENAGKTSLVKTLTAYAVKSGRQPVVVNLDPRQGMLSVPGSLTAAAFSSIVDVEDGWGSSPISGPSPVPVKMPLVYHYGLPNPEEGKLFKPLVTRMALAVTSRMEEDKTSKPAGFIIDTPGAIAQGKGGVYDNIEHIVSEFSVTILFVLGSERLYSDLSRKYSARSPSESISVIRLDKSGGCVDRDESYMRQLRQAQIKAYFFGPATGGDNALAPYGMSAEFEDLNILKIVDSSDHDPTLSSGDQHDYDPFSTTTTSSSSASQIYERIQPSAQMQNCLLAVTTSSANEQQDVIRDSSVRGYLYVADVDEAKKKVRLLSPQPGGTPSNAIVCGSWPEDVAGLLT